MNNAATLTAAAIIMNAAATFGLGMINVDLMKRIAALENAQQARHDKVSLDELIDQRRKELCGDLKRLPCLMKTGYWR